MASILAGCIFSPANVLNISYAQPVGFREYIDTFHGYSLKYSQNWIQVRGAGADIFFRDPYFLDENLSVDISSPSSSRYKCVEDLGSPEEAGKNVNIKSYANNNELAVMPQEWVARLEWDRRYLSVLGVENNRLYELRIQTPEKVFAEEESEIREIMDSFRVNKVSILEELWLNRFFKSSMFVPGHLFYDCVHP
ncbi:psbP domain-containing 1, chloroplastic [Olea europaea subsp. europaea]|uniref:PsbP domain-containing 1, chloroplastic n=1 Tax=Olea europaea subsp. europaea TaxID=158383 RepID=A0A8S0UEN0_OLEEU|nr:psbP domain-containing 1, chloroplastic [Olea europaea subsp. europaea]